MGRRGGRMRGSAGDRRGPAIAACPSFRIALVLAAGLSVLANSRPVEGGLLGLGAMGVLLYYERSLAAGHLGKFWAPLALVLIPTGIWMLYYDYRVTGNPLDTPYASHHRKYDIATPFIWDDKPAAPASGAERAHTGGASLGV